MGNGKRKRMEGRDIGRPPTFHRRFPSPKSDLIKILTGVIVLRKMTLFHMEESSQKCAVFEHEMKALNVCF
jgi:hypothetical protein